MKKELMSPERLAASLAIPDMTDPRNGVHAINLVVQKITEALSTNYPESTLEEVRSGPEVSVEENFDYLLFPADNAGRSSRYTRYVTEGRVLRTHTSAAVPGWLKRTANTSRANDAIVVFPGICFRRDVIDKTHCGELHQMDVWRIKKGSAQLGRPDLIHLVETILNSVVPGYDYRVNEVNHPYTINGLEVEILVEDKWIEVLECGEAHPKILENGGLSTLEFSGLALGMGLDRLVMIAKGIDDIRILRSKDHRITNQLVTLDKFVPVSNQPATKRVLSYSTSKDKTEEDVCEEIRDVLGRESSYIEEIQYSEVFYETLPQKARENLGIHPDQKNVVVTLIFRSPEGSLQRTMVNAWMERLYPLLNKGDRGYM